MYNMVFYEFIIPIPSMSDVFIKSEILLAKTEHKSLRKHTHRNLYDLMI